MTTQASTHLSPLPPTTTTGYNYDRYNYDISLYRKIQQRQVTSWLYAWKLVAPLISAFLLFLLRDPGLTHGWRLVGHGWIPGRKPRRCCRDLPRRKMDLAVALRWEPPRAGRGGPFPRGGCERDVREATQAPVDFHRAYLGCCGDPRRALIRIHAGSHGV